ncbi:mersacidin family lantibiotic [Microbacterium sp. APC 3898]|uniref:Mersacidin family lantibiotic n=2 Tax=Planococcus TaxID=1372 RepID=A0ABT7ZK06_9BACL|nr:MULTISPECIES: mersacidin family lantibiotic [Terrabacteria group]MBD8014518.1 type 2 lantibiotic [Planococcus wigleyi]MDN3427397.1 mersacidin family lantibiotic [Planococcus sp. APC 4016]MDN3436746.1 mersacidin family lantibiotic [Planococcus sp. APC 3900]MDN3499681.1 mersacidin family lantibiotic [Microbacterium sp. APC 3898]
MTKQQIINAWKNPEIRDGVEKVTPHPSGKAFNELTLDELAEVQGASDVAPETTPACVAAFATGLLFSIKFC